MPHRTDSQKIPFMTLIHRFTIFKQFTRNHAGGRNYYGIRLQRGRYGLNGGFSIQTKFIAALIVEIIIRKGSFLNDKSKRLFRFIHI